MGEESVLETCLKAPATTHEQETEVLQALLTKYAEHRGTGDDAKWTVITREFNLRLPEEMQKTENSVKRAAKKLQEAAQALEKVLAKFSEQLACTPDAEQE